MYFKIHTNEKGPALATVWAERPAAAAAAMAELLEEAGGSLADHLYGHDGNRAEYDREAAVDELAEDIDIDVTRQITLGPVTLDPQPDSFTYGTTPPELVLERCRNTAGGRGGAFTPEGLAVVIRALGQVQDTGQLGDYQFWTACIAERLRLLRALGIDEACGIPRGGAIAKEDHARLGFKRLARVPSVR